jgi:hypothetical protein
MARKGLRDNQRSRVYAWERKIKGYHRAPEWKKIEDVIAFATPVWKAERGRVGLARQELPLFKAGRGASASDSHTISLGRWARQTPIVLHEIAHRLTPHDEPHGPRFVGVLIGLLSRHAGYVAEELMALADEIGVKYHVRAVGSVPVRNNPASLIERAVLEEGPMTEMDLACWCDLTYLQVRGAAMFLIRQGKARWLRRKLVLLEPPTT